MDTINSNGREMDTEVPLVHVTKCMSENKQLSNCLEKVNTKKHISLSLNGDNLKLGENDTRPEEKHNKRNTLLRGRKLRIPDTCAHLGVRCKASEESNQEKGQLILQRPSSSTELTYENSPPKRDRNFIYKSCKLEREKIDQERNLPNISEDQVMPSLPIETLNNNEKLRKSSSYVFQKTSRRDSVVAKDFHESDRNVTRRTSSFTAPHKRRNSRYSIHRRSVDESDEGIEHVPDILKENGFISVVLPVQKLETDDRNYVCINIDTIRKALCDAGLKAGASTTRILSGQSYLVYECTENQVTPPSDKSEAAAAMPPLVSETQKCKQQTIGETISMMQKYPDDLNTQLKGCKSMGSFANDDSLSVLLAKNEGVTCLMTALTTYKNHTEILTAAIVSVARMCAASDASCVHIQKNGGIAELLRLTNSSNNIDVIEGAVDILGSMSAVEELLEKLVEDAVPSSVVTLLSRYEDNNKIVSNCCFILSNLANDYQTAKNVMYIGGVHVIVRIMERFRHDDLVHENACRALGSFSFHEDLSSDVSNAGGIVVVLQTLKNFQDSTAVLECALWALACLTKCTDAGEHICKKNEISTIIDTLKKYKYDETLQEYGCCTLCNISSSVQGAQELALPAIVETVCQCLTQFPDNLQLQQEIFIFLVPVLAISEDIQKKFIQDNRVSILLERMTTYIDCPVIQEHGCLIIGSLAVNKANRTVLERLNSSRTIITALLHHENSDKIHENAHIALTNLSAEIYGNKSTVERNGGVQAAITSLTSMSHNPDVVELALKLLGNLIELDASCHHFIEDKGLDVLETLLKENNFDQEIEVWIRNILIQLASARGIPSSDLENIERVLSTVSESQGSSSSVDVYLVQYYEKLVSNVSGCHMFMDGGSFDKLLDLLNINTTTYDLQFYGCKILAALAMSE
ncbi:uncharacterized protein LOC134239422 [Saccostrea cucullata]|uniref:uncharacterized protein LOC134239422 n=1 Tax=Saccostrea cuccullata TaxID=36930 RepID=UPI002ECFDFC9